MHLYDNDSNDALSPCLPTSDINCQIGSWIVIVGYPAILAIATIGNLLALIVLRRQNLRDHVTFFCLACLSCSDIVFIWNAVSRRVLGEVFGIDLNSTSNTFCRIVVLSTVASQFMSGAIIAFIATIRSFMIYYPFKARRLITRRRCITAILALAGFCITSFSFMGFGFEAFIPQHEWHNFTINRQLECTIISESFGKYAEPWIAFVAFVNVIIPIGLILFNSIMIVKKLNINRPSFNNDSPSEAAIARRNTPTKLVVTINVFHMLTVIPFYTHRIYVSNFEISAERSQSIKLVGDILYLILLCNHTFNFLIYMWTGSLFRKELFEMVDDLWHKLTALLYNRRTS